MRRGRISALLFSFVVVSIPAHAQDHPVIAEGHVGYASFVDDAPIEHSVLGAGARVFVTPRVAIGPEFTFMRGPGISRVWFLTGNATIDLVDSSQTRRRVVPYVIAGGGFARIKTQVGTGPFTSGEGTFTGGGGVRLSPGGGWFIAPEFRLGWELHWRVGASVGVSGR